MSAAASRVAARSGAGRRLVFIRPVPSGGGGTRAVPMAPPSAPAVSRRLRPGITRVTTPLTWRQRREDDHSWTFGCSGECGSVTRRR
ncbi:hypothetical protein [Ornithinimicrobium kibberense]|uniref:hypothetical protein n=1 Tax=Ornithinimicrobium kibberense TaxID=282060 RepID=UPI003624245D